MADLKRVLEYDLTTCTKTTFHYDWKTDTFTCKNSRTANR